MNITCVKCTSVLDKSRVGEIEVDVCPSCGGLWLDKGEIERIGTASNPDVDSLRKELTGGAQAGLSDTLTACPSCPGKLREVRLGRVMVDVCVSCGGMFLDRGELDSALAAVRGSTVEQVLAAASAAARR
jgi:Zn-finger nucleic acid-binding protein